jgi:hypothetical protein
VFFRERAGGGAKHGVKALIAGWFSFEGMGASAGDLLVRDLVGGWLSDAGVAHDVALAPPFRGGLDWRTVDPADFTHVIFVCGPFGNGPPVDEFLARFTGRTLIGLDLTMLDPLEVWNPFHLLLERDSSAATRPDFSMLSEKPKVPVVGLILIDAQPEYGARDWHRQANEALELLAERRECAVLRIDTRLDVNQTGLRTDREVESLIAKSDLVLTTRLHGLVLSLKNGIPVVAVDPVAGGGKITRQGEALRWPLVLAADLLDRDQLETAYQACFEPELRERAAQCRSAALDRLADVHPRLIRALLGRPES